MTLKTTCHPERSLAMSEANRQTKSKDLVSAGTTTAAARSSLHAFGPGCT